MLYNMPNNTTTKRLLEETHRINRDIKAANIRAGARYKENTSFDNDSPYGEGAHKKKLDMPSTDHEYRSFTLKREKKEPYHWYVELEDFVSAPDLKGKWSDLPSLEKAVDAYLAQHPGN